MSEPRGRLAGWAGAGLLFAFTLALYAATRHNGFVAYDDGTYVAQNPHLTHGPFLHRFWWALTSVGYACNWHPLTWLSHMLDVSWFGFAAGGHHLHNAVLHAANAALVFLVLRAATGRDLASLAVAALFAVQPQRVESVAWVSERKDLLAGFWGLAAIGLHVVYARRGRTGWLLLSLVALLLGLAAKPTLVTLPALLLVLDRWPLGRTAPWRRLLSEKLPHFALALGAAALTLHAQTGGGCTDFAGPDLGLGGRLVNAIRAYGHYLGRALWPTDLAVFYPHPALVAPGSSRLATLLPPLATLGVCTGSALALRRRAPVLLTGWLWFLGMLLPMIGLVQVGAQAYADRYTYLPLLGIELAAVFGVAELARSSRAVRGVASALLLLALGAFALRTHAQIRVWASTRTLFEHALAVTESNYVAHINLGRLDGSQGRLSEARRHFERAVAANPASYEAQVNLGWALFLQGEADAALEALDRALALQPDNGDGHYKRGRVVASMGRTEEALGELRAAVRLDPGHAAAARALAELEGRNDE